ncbi:hypothetical protein U1Q18_009459 [Sarracenia purpurea var. burkii]
MVCLLPFGSIKSFYFIGFLCYVRCCCKWFYCMILFRMDLFLALWCDLRSGGRRSVFHALPRVGSCPADVADCLCSVPEEAGFLPPVCFAEWVQLTSISVWAKEFWYL